MRPIVSLLSIGSELTTGLILNSNAKTLSMLLTDSGFAINKCLTIPDSMEAIRDSLDYCAKDSNIVITTGGLGPTSDDFSTEAISKWAGEELVFSSESWQKIEEIFSQFGSEPSPSNRDQCFFPKSATRIVNNAGTADGFYLEKNNFVVVVLPGPPREISQIWSDSLEGLMLKKFKPPRPKNLKKWLLQGVSESVLQDLLQATIDSYPEMEFGFRPHFPTIELRLTYDLDDAKWNNAISEVSRVVSKWYLRMSQQEASEAWQGYLADFDEIYIDDCCLNGQFLQVIIDCLPPACTLFRGKQITKGVELGQLQISFSFEASKIFSQIVSTKETLQFELEVNRSFADERRKIIYLCSLLFNHLAEKFYEK